jgi:hypothetical protein
VPNNRRNNKKAGFTRTVGCSNRNPATGIKRIHALDLPRVKTAKLKTLAGKAGQRGKYF